MVQRNTFYGFVSADVCGNKIPKYKIQKICLFYISGNLLLFKLHLYFFVALICFSYKMFNFLTISYPSFPQRGWFVPLREFSKQSKCLELNHVFSGNFKGQEAKAELVKI